MYWRNDSRVFLCSRQSVDAPAKRAALSGNLAKRAPLGTAACACTKLDGPRNISANAKIRYSAIVDVL